MNEQPKLAVLIDAENVSNKYVKLIMDEVSNYGVATYKRVYGDYSNPSVSAWMKNMQEYALTPGIAVQLYCGKKCFRFGIDYRCHGYSLFRQSQRFLPGVVRQ